MYAVMLTFYALHLVSQNFTDSEICTRYLITEKCVPDAQSEE